MVLCGKKFEMHCPNCGKEMRKGIVEAKNAGSFTQSLTQVLWYPQDSEGSSGKKEAVTLRLKADGYYCDECMMVFAAFEEK